MFYSLRKLIKLILLILLIHTHLFSWTVQDEDNYLQAFKVHFQERPFHKDLIDYASVEIFNQKLFELLNQTDLTKLNNGNGELAWNWSYVMMALNEMYLATGDRNYLDINKNLIKSIILSRDDYRQIKLDNGNSVPGWSSVKYTKQRSVFSVHTAMILNPMLEYVLHSQKKWKWLLEHVEECLDYTANEWNKALGCYVGKGEELSCEDKPLPLNRLSAIGYTNLLMWKITKKKKYYKTCKILAHYIKDRLYIGNSGEYCWNYYLPKNIPKSKTINSKTATDDLSHGALSILFPVKLAQEHIVFNKSDLNMFVKSFLNGCGSRNDGILFTGTNGDPSLSLANLQIVSRWMCLENEEVYNRLWMFYKKYVENPHLLDIAYLIRYNPNSH